MAISSKAINGLYFDSFSHFSRLFRKFVFSDIFEQTFRSNFFFSENLGCGVEGIGSISPHLTKRIQTRRTWRLFKIKTRKVLDEETSISSALIIFESNFSKRQTHALKLKHTHLRTYTHTPTHTHTHTKAYSPSITHTHRLRLKLTHLQTYTHTVHREAIHNVHRKARRWTRILGFEPRPAVRKAKL